MLSDVLERGGGMLGMEGGVIYLSEISSVRK
jgi:hypothetical protein